MEWADDGNLYLFWDESLSPQSMGLHRFDPADSSLETLPGTRYGTQGIAPGVGDAMYMVCHFGDASGYADGPCDGADGQTTGWQVARYPNNGDVPSGQAPVVMAGGVTGFEEGWPGKMDVSRDIEAAPSKQAYFVSDHHNHRVRVYGSKTWWEAYLAGFPNAVGFAHDPVNTASGSFTHQRVDLDAPPGVFGLALDRTYNSSDARNGPFGPGWSSSFDASLELLSPRSPDATDVVFWSGTGQAVWFDNTSSGTWTRPWGIKAKLTWDDDLDRYTIAYDDGRSLVFSSAGRLLEKRNWDNQVVTLSYNAATGMLESASNNLAGLSLTFTDPTGDGKIDSVSATGGRTVSYVYDTGGALNTVTWPYTSGTGSTAETYVTADEQQRGECQVLCVRGHP
jgi:hypothetical protein